MESQACGENRNENTESPTASRDTFPVSISSDLEPLIEDYLENRRDDCQNLRRALADRDFATIEMLGHRMKGSGGSYGFCGLTTIGAALETACRSQDLESIEAQLSDLERYLAQVEFVYE